MAKFRYQLPPLNYLVAFEAAAKHSNFTEAAQALNVSRAAISYQVKAIESFVGKPLFHRLNRSVRLTPEGEKMFTVVSRSLEEILDVVLAIENDPQENTVTVTTTTGFSTYWLLPRVGSFRAAFPDIEINLIVADRYIDIDEENVDVAIRYFRDDLIDPSARFLLKQQVAPTCSSTYRTSLKSNSGAEELLSERLIYLEGRKYDARSKWRSWFRQNGIHVSKLPAGITVDNYANLIQACEAGEGFALLGPPLITEQVRTGTLVQPLKFGLMSIGSFYLKLRNMRTPNSAVGRFCDWIIQESLSAEEQAGSLIRPRDLG
ncbi:LysR substrate-binding domain-containing protein [Mesorhizobium sp. M1329]|uniref:LysR substrate-binding domain-containing protein n=1 Tax=Mesorhizobium sp. M1329 TaxID=2957083 RepID=UPI003338DF26